VNPVRQLVDDTKGNGVPAQPQIATGELGILVEKPEVVMEKIHLQATYLGPVMEELLRAAHGRGESRWGINE
jgi:hypothetical protein